VLISVAPLVLLAVLGAAPRVDLDPAVLVVKLGSADPSDRAAATESLRVLGRKALPNLQEAMKADDNTLRERAAAVWETIERELMTRPSMVRLESHRRSTESVLQDLETQTGLRFQPDGASFRPKPGSLKEEAPISIWLALDRLGFRAIDHWNLGDGKFPVLNLLYDPVYAFNSISGPFRMSLLGLHWHRDRQLIRGPWVRIDRFGQRIKVPSEELKGETVTYYGRLHVMVEPRMWFTEEAPARLTEASDDLGQSLVPDAAGLETKLSEGAHFAFNGGRGVTEVGTEFRLRSTEKPGQFARLRGVVPVMLHMRRPEPMLVIPLKGAAGKTFSCADADFTIRRVSDSPMTSATTVSMTVSLNVARADLSENRDPELIRSRLQVMGAHQLELINAEGIVVADSTGSGGSDSDSPSLYHWNINTFQNGRATHLRYFSMFRVKYDAAFDFQDVPLP
jgi:hypothetical protein